MPARLLLPAFFPHPPSLSPHSPTSLTFNQRDYEQKWSIKLNCHSNSSPRRQSFKTSTFPTSVMPGHRPTCPPSRICMESTTKEGAPVAEGLQEETNGIGDSRKERQRQNHAHHWQQLTRAQLPGGWFPAKFGCQPIKLELYPHAHTYPAKCLRVHFRHLGVYKESQVATEPFRLGLAKV